MTLKIEIFCQNLTLIDISEGHFLPFWGSILEIFRVGLELFMKCLGSFCLKRPNFVYFSYKN